MHAKRATRAYQRAQAARCLVVMLACVAIVAPTAAADRTIVVGSMTPGAMDEPDPISERIAFDFVPPLVPGNSETFSHFIIEHQSDYGDLSRRTGDRNENVEFEISNATQTVLVRYENGAHRNFAGLWGVTQTVYVNGEPAWRWHTDSYQPFSFRYRQTSAIQWDNNTLSCVETRPPREEWLGVCVTRATTVEHAIYYIPPENAGAYFTDPSGGDVWQNPARRGVTDDGRVLLAAMTNVTSVAVTAEYAHGPPEALHVRYLFENYLTETSRQDQQDCGGFIRNGIGTVIGTCPSVLALIERAVNLVAAIVQMLFAFIPGSGRLISGMGSVVTELLSLYFLALALFLAAPVKWSLVIAGHVVLYSFLFAAFKGEPRQAFSDMANGFRITGLVMFYYVAGLWFASAAALDLAKWSIEKVGDWVRG